ncbi:MAG: short-chain dehydrogenase/reductase [Nevskia sp.]|nr:short-chain dehydrogenase/reductase [Nevskia sp.]
MNPSSILITGASSGIGRGLAIAYSAPGVVLHLCGRNIQRLEATAEACRARGAEVHLRIIDVTDAEGMRAWIGALGALDLVFANAGISAGTSGGRDGGTRERTRQVRAIFATNVDGVINTVLPAMDLMETQPSAGDGVRGHIVAIASVAAFLAYPGTPTYCASKVAVDFWTTASAPSARARGIVLSSVCPGFVRTAMTAANTFKMPGLMDTERAVAIIQRGVRARKRRIVFPWWIALGARFLQLLPPAWTARALTPQASMEPMAD